MIRESIVSVAIMSVSLLLAFFITEAEQTIAQHQAITTEPTSTLVQHQDITTREYWIDRGYEVINDAWCAGENIWVQLYKDQEVITINYEEQRVSSCRGGYNGCYVDYIDEVKVLYTEE